MKNIKLCMIMTLIVISPTTQLLTAETNTASIASAQTAMVNPSPTTMGLSSEITAPRSTLSIDGPTVATPSAAIPVENATLLTAASPTAETSNVVVASVAPATTTEPVQSVTTASVEESAAPAQKAVEVKAPSIPTTANSTSVPTQGTNCWWANAQATLNSTLTTVSAFINNGWNTLKSMIA